MNLRRLLILLSLLIFAPMLRADTTLRYTFTLKSSGMLPPDALASPEMKDLLKGMTIQVKGNKEFSSFSLFACIVDLDKQEVTFLDATHHRYALVPLPDLAAQLAASRTDSPNPAAAAQMQKMMQSMRVKADSRDTGNTDTVLGIPVEETEMTVNVSMDLGAMGGASANGAPGGAGIGSGELNVMRMVIDMWTASAPAVASHPELGELTAFAAANMQMDNPMSLFQGGMADMPGVADGMKSVFEQMAAKKAVMLKADVSMYVPMLAGLASMAQKSGDAAAATTPAPDPKAPLAVFDVTASELSAAPVADSVFVLPDGYAATSLPAFMKDVMPAPPALPTRPTAASGAASGPGAPAGRGPALAKAPPLTPLPSVTPLAVGEKLAPTQTQWLAQATGQPSSTVIDDPRFPPLLAALVPDATYHRGSDMPLAEAINHSLHGPSQPVEVLDHRYVVIPTRDNPTGRGRALVWFDPQQGLGFGGMALYFTSGRPSPALSLFSTQVGAEVTREDQLPPALLISLATWSADQHLPATMARFFINHDGRETVLLHPSTHCPADPTAAAICQGVNQDAADTDMQAIYYLLRQHLGAGSAAAALESSQQEWLRQRAACAAPGCQLDRTRQRAEELSRIYLGSQ